MTIPPSRALLQQRDYRARKAQYIADLEERARKAEEENVKLKREIDSLRMRTTSTGSMGPSPEVVRPCFICGCYFANDYLGHRSLRRPSSCTSSLQQRPASRGFSSSPSMNRHRHMQYNRHRCRLRTSSHPRHHQLSGQHCRQCTKQSTWQHYPRVQHILLQHRHTAVIHNPASPLRLGPCCIPAGMPNRSPNRRITIITTRLARTFHPFTLGNSNIQHTHIHTTINNIHTCACLLQKRLGKPRSRARPPRHPPLPRPPCQPPLRLLVSSLPPPRPPQPPAARECEDARALLLYTMRPRAPGDTLIAVIWG